MPEAEALSQLIADIYDAALEAQCWPEVLRQCCEFVGGYGSTLFAQDSARPHATLFYNYNNDPQFLQLYLEKYVHMNPFVPAVTFPDVGEVFTTRDLISDAELRQTRFYREFQAPQGIVDAMFVNLEKSGTSNMTMSVIGTEQTGIFDTLQRRRLSLLVPHVRRAVVIGHMLAGHEAEKVALANVLGKMDSAVFLVDASARITFANEAARRMLQEGTILRSDDGVLAATSRAINQSLREAFARACDGDAALGSVGLAISLKAQPDDRLLAHVLPLTSGSRRQQAAAHSAVAAVFVRKAGLNVQSPLEIVSRIYKLTATEVRVLQGIVEVGGAPQIAERLGVGKSTIRTHLRSLFAKTGVSRQADLVRLVYDHASPFGNEGGE